MLKKENFSEKVTNFKVFEIDFKKLKTLKNILRENTSSIFAPSITTTTSKTLKYSLLKKKKKIIINYYCEENKIFFLKKIMPWFEKKRLHFLAPNNSEKTSK